MDGWMDGRMDKVGLERISEEKKSEWYLGWMHGWMDDWKEVHMV